MKIAWMQRLEEYTQKFRKQKWEENRYIDTSKEIAHEMTWTWLRRGNLKRETVPNDSTKQYNKD